MNGFSPLADARTHREAETAVVAKTQGGRPQTILKAGKVAAAIAEELRKIPPGTFDNPRTTYRDVHGRRCRDVAIFNPIANLHPDGRWITVNYAPHRDEGKRLSLDTARRYLAWLRDGGRGTHWTFFRETFEEATTAPETALGGYERSE